jgi:hypothetical protein
VVRVQRKFYIEFALHDVPYFIGGKVMPDAHQFTCSCG